VKAALDSWRPRQRGSISIDNSFGMLAIGVPDGATGSLVHKFHEIIFERENPNPHPMVL